MNLSRFFLKFLAVLMFAAAFAPITHASEEVPVPQPNIEFLDEVYALAWRSDPMPGYSKAEYLPADERLPYYHNMLLVERVSGISVTEAVRVQVEHLKALDKSEDVLTGASIVHLIENPGTGEVLLVFIVNAPDEKHELILEWNAYRYSPDTGGDGQPIVRLFGYSVRNYGNDASIYDFLEELDVDNMQSRRINAVARAEIP